MEGIRIILPPRSLYTFGPVVVHDMERRAELARAAQGTELWLTPGESLELGIAWGRGNTPPVKLRFTAVPGQTYLLYWLTEGFGAGMGVMEMHG